MSEFRRRLMMQKAGGYEIVDHILTNGLAYIDTGYFVNPNTEVEMDCKVGVRSIQHGGNVFFGAADGELNYAFNHGATGSDNLVQADCFFWCPKSYASGAAIKSLYMTFNKQMLVGIRKLNGVWNGFCDTANVNLVGAPQSMSTTLLLLCSPAKGIPYNLDNPLTLYSFKITENGEVIKHFLPAKKGDIYGMAEIIEGKFYASPNGESFDY